MKTNKILSVLAVVLLTVLILLCVKYIIDSDTFQSLLQTDTSSNQQNDPTLNEEIAFMPMEEAGQGKGFLIDSDGNIAFSMKIKELAAQIEKGKKLSDYQIRLRFIVRDTVGRDYFAYPQITLPIHLQDEKEFSVLLQSEDFDSGFCPTAERSYRVEVTVIQNGKEILEGTWERMYANAKLSSSAYYRPTEIPSDEQRAEYSFTVQYLAKEGGRIEGQVTQTLACGVPSDTVTAVAEQGYLFWCWSDGVKTEQRTGDVIVYDKEIYALFTKDELDPGIPNMYIETSNRSDITSKEVYVWAEITVRGAKENKFNFSSLSASVRGRGNSSFSSTASQLHYNSKNSYRLKFDEKINLLGVGDSSNRDWILHSNKFDASNLRNYFVWNLANQLDSLSFVPSCTWVNLYVNGDYRGIYMISEQVEVADDRIEIDDSGSDPDKGYLVELDMRGQLETGAVEGLDYFYLPGFYDKDIVNLREWVIKSEVNTKQETAFIRNYFINCHRAIMSGDEEQINALMDVDSLVDMFILQELSKDVDGGGASIFWQKEKGGKLAFTAPWDYDFGMGSYGVAVKTTDFVCETETGGNKPNLWLQSLLKQEWFWKRLYSRMQEANDMVDLAIRSVRMQAAVLKPAADRNDRKWNIYGSHFNSYLHVQVSSELDSYEEHIDFLCHWIETRWDWMTTEIESRVKLCNS